MHCSVSFNDVVRLNRKKGGQAILSQSNLATFGEKMADFYESPPGEQKLQSEADSQYARMTINAVAAK
jgi:hypothetical protein